MRKAINLAGMRFGRLVAIEKAAPHIYSNGASFTAWKCHCDCGNDCIVNTNLLRSGQTKSCGCLQKERASDAAKVSGKTRRESGDLTGKHFGRWTVISEDKFYMSNHDRRWNCKCKCGRLAKVLGSSLISGESKSCGCLQKERARSQIKSNVQDYCGTRISEIKSDKPTIRNKSGTRGVFWNKQRCKWCAVLQIKGTIMLHDFYDSIDDAIEARKEAEEKYFKPVIEEYKAAKGIRLDEPANTSE